MLVEPILYFAISHKCEIYRLSCPLCKQIAAARVFTNAQEAEERILGCADDQSMVDTAARFLMANLPPPDRNVTIARHAASERTLQRLFRRYVGATPRWVVKRYRMYEALEHLNEATPSALAALAQNLGYFDQAHFTNDFKKLIGRPPSEYADG